MINNPELLFNVVQFIIFTSNEFGCGFAGSQDLLDVSLLVIPDFFFFLRNNNIC